MRLIASLEGEERKPPVDRLQVTHRSRTSGTAATMQPSCWQRLPVGSNRAPPLHRPREDGLTHPTDTFKIQSC